MDKLEIRVDAERLGEMVTVDEFIAMQEGNIRVIVNVLANFCVNGSGGYMEHDEARAVLGQMTIKQLTEAAQAFAGNAEGAAVPLSSGKI